MSLKKGFHVSCEGDMGNFISPRNSKHRLETVINRPLDLLRKYHKHSRLAQGHHPKLSVLKTLRSRQRGNVAIESRDGTLKEKNAANFLSEDMGAFDLSVLLRRQKDIAMWNLQAQNSAIATSFHSVDLSAKPAANIATWNLRL